MNVQKIQFGKNLPPEIFSSIAEDAAETISANRNANKSTQLRKFYDELVMFNDRLQAVKREQRESRFKEMEPFIRMLNAKAAYAQGRQLVDDNFVKILSQCIREIKDYETLRHCKLFMEAMIGFRKAKEATR